MKNIYDENNHELDDDAQGENEFDGYSVMHVDDDGNETDVTGGDDLGNKPKSKNDAQEEVPEASTIPENEQTVMIDNASIAKVAVGTLLELKIKNANSMSVYDGTKKVGDLKAAFSQKLLETRKGQHVECFLHSKDSLVLIKLKYYVRARKNTIKLVLP